MSNYYKNYYELTEQLDQLKAELKSAKELREYTYDCCKRAGEELAKNSFEWDGKEKNLVVQAMELNERYDQLKKANDEKNELLAQLGCPTVGTARQLTLSLKEQLEAYKMEAEEGKEVNVELKAALKDISFENQKFCYQIEELTKQLKPFQDEYFKGLETIVIAGLAKKSIRITAENSKLEQTLTEIKEIAEKRNYLDYNECLDDILQKISECEV